MVASKVKGLFSAATSPASESARVAPSGRTPVAPPRDMDSAVCQNQPAAPSATERGWGESLPGPFGRVSGNFPWLLKAMVVACIVASLAGLIGGLFAK